MLTVRVFTTKHGGIRNGVMVDAYIIPERAVLPDSSPDLEFSLTLMCTWCQYFGNLSCGLAKQHNTTWLDKTCLCLLVQTDLR